MYFKDDETPIIDFFPSGFTLYDGILGFGGKGFPSGRLLNIQGPTSSGKTYIAEQAAKMHLALWPDGYVGYADTEVAFDYAYAQRIGIPIDKIDFIQDLYTIEDWFSFVEEKVDELPDESHGLLVLDSLDALSSKDEMERKITDASYGGERAKKMAETLRRINGFCAKKRISVIIISQLRDAMNSRIPGMKTISGGKAIEFYSSVIIRLAVIGKIKKQMKGVDRIVGNVIQATCIKNKVGTAWGKANLNFIFNKGFDNLSSNLAWLISKETGRLNCVEQIPAIGDTKVTRIQKSLVPYIKKLKTLSDAEYLTKCDEIDQLTRKTQLEIEQMFSGSGGDEEISESTDTDED